MINIVDGVKSKMSNGMFKKLFPSKDSKIPIVYFWTKRIAPNNTM